MVIASEEECLGVRVSRQLAGASTANPVDLRKPKRHIVGSGAWLLKDQVGGLIVEDRRSFMMKIAKLLAGTAIAMVPGYALAQAPAPGAVGQAGAATPTADVVVAAIENLETETTALEGVEGEFTVNIVALDSLIEGAEGESINTALEGAETQVNALRTAVAENQYIMGQLGAAGLVTTHVVAVDVADDGTVTIYTAPIQFD
jgi:hypothetical protein